MCRMLEVQTGRLDHNFYGMLLVLVRVCLRQFTFRDGVVSQATMTCIRLLDDINGHPP